MKNVIIAIIAAVALHMSGCYGAQDSGNWVLVEDIDTDTDSDIPNTIAPTPSLIQSPNCLQILIDMVENQCDACAIMLDECPEWLEKHTKEGKICVEGSPFVDWSCDDLPDGC